MKLLRFDLFRDISHLAVGTILAQLIPFLLQPLLSRLYTPADYAVYGLYIAIIGWFDVVSTGRYELVVTLPRRDEDAMNLVAGGILIALGLVLLLEAAAWIFADPFSALLKNQGIRPFLPLIPLVVLLMAGSKMFNYWLIRKRAFKQSSVNKVAQRAGEGAASSGFGMVRLSGGLVLGDLTGRCANLIMAAWQARRAGWRWSSIRIGRMGSALSQYARFPLYNSLPAILNTSATLMPILIISARYGDETLGFFNFSRLILMVPMSLLAYSISQVLLQRITHSRNEGLSIRSDISGVIRTLGMLSLLMFLIIFPFGPPLFAFVFGEQWSAAGEFSQIMIFSYAIQFLVTPLSIALVALDRIKLFSLWQATYFLAIGALFLVGEWPITSFLILLTVVEAGFYIIYFLLILKEVSLYERLRTR